MKGEKEQITKARRFLSQRVTVVIDRPMGSRHPIHGIVYPVNYGFIPKTLSQDGHELDAYVLGVFKPVRRFSGVCIAVIHRTNDRDDKLVVVPEGKSYTNEQVRALTEFQERFFKSVVYRR